MDAESSLVSCVQLALGVVLIYRTDLQLMLIRYDKIIYKPNIEFFTLSALVGENIIYEVVLSDPPLTAVDFE